MKRTLIFLVAGLLGATLVNAEEQPTPPPPAPPKHQKPAMTDEQRALTEEHLSKEWNSMSLENKMRLMRLHRALHQMPPEERRFIQDRVERFLNMSPEDRARLEENRKKWDRMSPEERERAREQFHKRRQEFEQKWRQEHPGEEPPPFPFHRQKGPPPDAGVPAPPPAPMPPPQGQSQNP
jgi:hypothetical protein